MHFVRGTIGALTALVCRIIFLGKTRWMASEWGNREPTSNDTRRVGTVWCHISYTAIRTYNVSIHTLIWGT